MSVPREELADSLMHMVQNLARCFLSFLPGDARVWDTQQLRRRTDSQGRPPTLKPDVLFFFFFLGFEGKGGRKTGRETSMCGCLLSAPYWGPGPKPRHVP